MKSIAALMPPEKLKWVELVSNHLELLLDRRVHERVDLMKGSTVPLSMQEKVLNKLAYAGYVHREKLGRKMWRGTPYRYWVDDTNAPLLTTVIHSEDNMKALMFGVGTFKLKDGVADDLVKSKKEIPECDVDTAYNEDQVEITPEPRNEEPVKRAEKEEADGETSLQETLNILVTVAQAQAESIIYMRDKIDRMEADLRKLVSIWQ